MTNYMWTFSTTNYDDDPEFHGTPTMAWFSERQAVEAIPATFQEECNEFEVDYEEVKKYILNEKNWDKSAETSKISVDELGYAIEVYRMEIMEAD